jgi:hypothetical protein
MFSPFKELLLEHKVNFIINVIQAIMNFLIHENNLWKLNDS